VLLGEGGEDGALGGRGVLQLVDDQVREAVRDRASDVRALGQQLAQRQEDVAAVEVAARRQDAVVRRVELGELRLRWVGARLERVDPLQQAGHQAGRVAADLVLAQRQLIEPVKQHRQSLRPPQHLEERIEPRGIGVLAQQTLADRLPGADPELLVRSVQEGLHPLAQPLRGGAGGCQEQHAIRLRPLAGQPRQAAGQQLGLAGSRPAEHQQRPVAMSDRPLLCRCQVHCPTLARH